MIEPGVPIIITEEQLRELVSDLEIASTFVPDFEEINKPFFSPFRNEKNPSCRVFDKRNSGVLWFKDFGNPMMPKAMTLVDFVMKHEGYSTRQETINHIYKSFKIRLSNTKLASNITGKRDVVYSASQLVIRIKKREWSKHDIRYWSSYHVPIEMLDRNNVVPISHIWLEKDGKTVFHTEFAKTHLVYSYEYYWHEGIFRRKIYRPELSNQHKWVTNTDYTVVQNVDNIPKGGDLLISQSSYKDCMVMEVLGYYSVAPNSEGVWYPSNYWEKINNRWDKIVIYGNNDWKKKDNPGLAYSRAHSEMYNIPYIINPDNTTSDIAAYVKQHGKDEGRRLVDKLLKEVL